MTIIENNTTAILKLFKVEEGLWSTADTKYLSGIKVYKGAYEYTVEGKCKHNGRTFGYGRTQKDVTKWINEYDQTVIDELAQQAERDREREIAREERLKNIRVAYDFYCNNTADKDPKVGDRLNAKFASLNKNSSVGEYVLQCSLPEFDHENKYRDGSTWKAPKNWAISAIKIVAVIALTDVQYDELSSRRDLR